MHTRVLRSAHPKASAAEFTVGQWRTPQILTYYCDKHAHTDVSVFPHTWYPRTGPVPRVLVLQNKATYRVRRRIHKPHTPALVRFNSSREKKSARFAQKPLKTVPIRQQKCQMHVRTEPSKTVFRTNHGVKDILVQKWCYPPGYKQDRNVELCTLRTASSSMLGQETCSSDRHMRRFHTAVLALVQQQSFCDEPSALPQTTQRRSKTPKTASRPISVSIL